MAADVATEEIPSEVEAPSEFLDLPKRPLLHVLLLMCASFGTYAGFWIWGAARKLRAYQPAMLHPFWWLASLGLGLTALASLPTLGSRIQSVKPETGQRSASWFLGIPYVLGSMTINLEFLIALSLFLVAIPLLLLQGKLNRSSDSEPLRLTARHWVLLVIGLPLFALAIWNEGPIYRAWLSPGVERGELLTTPDGFLEFRMKEDHWARVEPGSIGDEDSILEMQDRFTNSFIIVFRYDNNLSLDQVVRARISILREAETLANLEEERRFDDAEMPRYVVSKLRAETERTPLEAASTYATTTVKSGSSVYEVVGFGTGMRTSEVPTAVHAFRPSLTEEDL